MPETEREKQMENAKKLISIANILQNNIHRGKKQYCLPGLPVKLIDHFIFLCLFAQPRNRSLEINAELSNMV
jgi:hypothetical protein